MKLLSNTGKKKTQIQFSHENPIIAAVFLLLTFITINPKRVDWKFTANFCSNMTTNLTQICLSEIENTTFYRLGMLFVFIVLKTSFRCCMSDSFKNNIKNDIL